LAAKRRAARASTASACVTPSRCRTINASGTPNNAAVNDENTLVTNGLLDQNPAWSPHHPSPSSTAPALHSTSHKTRNPAGVSRHIPRSHRTVAPALPHHRKKDATAGASGAAPQVR
jgi:hypothetical protein